MPRKKAPQSGKVSVHIGSSFPAARENVLSPWFEKTVLAALTNEKPAGIVVPARPHADFLRRQLLERGSSLLGLRFFTPLQLREFLLKSGRHELSLREHLRLLLAMAAEEFSGSGKIESPEAAIARSISRDPDSFLRALDQLRAAGFDLKYLQPPLLGQIATRFEKL